MAIYPKTLLGSNFLIAIYFCLLFVTWALNVTTIDTYDNRRIYTKTMIIVFIIGLCNLCVELGLYSFLESSLCKLFPILSIIVACSALYIYNSYASKLLPQTILTQNYVDIGMDVETVRLNWDFGNIEVINIPLDDQPDLDINDRHNVHNITLKRTCANIIKYLQDTDTDTNKSKTGLNILNELIELCQSTQNTIKNKALICLTQVKNMDCTYNSLIKIKESEVLRLIWNRIMLIENNDTRNQVIDLLWIQLSDCINYGNVLHCTEGRIMRYLQVLEHQLDFHLKPLWLFKQEITNVVPKIRDKILSKLPQSYVDLYNTIDLDDCDLQDKLLYEKIKNCIIKNLNNKFNKDYIKHNLLTQQELDSFTTPLYEHI